MKIISNQPLKISGKDTKWAFATSYNNNFGAVSKARTWDLAMPLRISGEDVTWAIRQPDVNRYVSTVSAYPGVRTALTAQQRRIASRGDIVMVGRDIGTVVLPNADLKVYLSASAEERARRRWLEEQARDGQRSLAEVLDDVRLRDRVDSNRAVSPLRAASDAMVIDTSDRTVEEVVATIVQRLALGVRNLGDLPS